jgi:polar amino acid transport system permease protein
MLKGTSLAFVVSVVDMTSAGQLAASRTYRYLEMYIALALLYWILSGLFSGIFRVAEKVLKRNERARAFATSKLAQRLTRLVARKTPSVAVPTTGLAATSLASAGATLHTERSL